MAYFAPYIDETGLHMPTFDDRLEEFWTRYCEIFGADPDTASSAPDYQLLSLLARNLDDVSQFVSRIYESMNPGIEPDGIGIYYYTGYQSAPSAAGNGLAVASSSSLQLLNEAGELVFKQVVSYDTPVVFGSAQMKGMHGIDERVDIRCLPGAVDFFKALMK